MNSEELRQLRNIVNGDLENMTVIFAVCDKNGENERQFMAGEADLAHKLAIDVHDSIHQYQSEKLEELLKKMFEGDEK